MEGQVLCFMVGVGLIFVGDKLLIILNFEFNEDVEMFNIFGFVFKQVFVDGEKFVLYFDVIIEEKKVRVLECEV